MLEKLLSSITDVAKLPIDAGVDVVTLGEVWTGRGANHSGAWRRFKKARRDGRLMHALPG
jgi:hypothetical protein